MAISSTPVDEQNSSEILPVKIPLVPLIVAMTIVVFMSILLLGGVAWYLLHSGRLTIPGSAQVKTKVMTPTIAAHNLVLEPIVANLADTNGSAYLKIALTLRIADTPLDKEQSEEKEKSSKEISDTEAAVRDTVLTVVGRQTADGLLSPDGKGLFKTKLKDALAERSPELKVLDLYFTDFLVQR